MSTRSDQSRACEPAGECFHWQRAEDAIVGHDNAADFLMQSVFREDASEALDIREFGHVSIQRRRSVPPMAVGRRDVSISYPVTATPI